MKKYALIMVCYVLFASYTGRAEGKVALIVNQTAQAYDTFKSIGDSAKYVVTANSAIKYINGSWTIIGSNLEKIATFGSNMSAMFVSPLTDGRYLVTALTSKDWNNVTYYAGKLSLYYFFPLCYDLLGYAEAGKSVLSIYETALKVNERWNEYSFKEFAKSSKCDIL